MKAPSNTQMMIAAVVLFLGSAFLLDDYYPAQHPLVGSDGSILHGSDGKVLYDVERFDQEVKLRDKKAAAAFTLFGCSGLLVIYVVIRKVRA